MTSDGNYLQKLTAHSEMLTRAQIVGWPPVGSYRKNNLQMKKPVAEALGKFVKVGMDGAPYLRKIDLKQYKSYADLLKALENLFNLSIGKRASALHYNFFSPLAVHD